jgi:hypothetical protein
MLFSAPQISASIHIHPPKIPVINQDINKDYKPKQKPGFLFIVIPAKSFVFG